MKKEDGICCQFIVENKTKLDGISQRVASNLNGRSIQEKIDRESKIFSENPLNKRG